jgi:hypothetical protein
MISAVRERHAMGDVIEPSPAYEGKNLDRRDRPMCEARERLEAIIGVCTPAHVVLALGIALPATRRARFELSTVVYGTAIPGVRRRVAPRGDAALVGSRASVGALRKLSWGPIQKKMSG